MGLALMDWFRTTVPTVTGLCAVLLGSAAIAREPAENPGIVMGNGEANWIVVDQIERLPNSTYTEQRITSNNGAVRRGDGTTLVFSEVHIAEDGWLVVHPFIDGKPNGDYVAGYSFVSAGTNNDVAVMINPAPDSGTMFLVMLHSDSNADRVFDFVFVDDTHVEDRAVFEGNRMIAHIFAAP